MRFLGRGWELFPNGDRGRRSGGAPLGKSLAQAPGSLLSLGFRGWDWGSLSPEPLWFVHCSSWVSSEASEQFCAGGDPAGLQDKDLRKGSSCQGGALEKGFRKSIWDSVPCLLCTWIIIFFSIGFAADFCCGTEMIPAGFRLFCASGFSVFGWGDPHETVPHFKDPK